MPEKGTEFPNQPDKSSNMIENFPSVILLWRKVKETMKSFFKGRKLSEAFKSALYHDLFFLKILEKFKKSEYLLFDQLARFWLPEKIQLSTELIFPMLTVEQNFKIFENSNDTKHSRSVPCEVLFP